MGLQVRRILVPVDFSASTQFALENAQAIAEQFEAEVRLIHVVERSPYEVYQATSMVQGQPMLERVGTLASRTVNSIVVRDLLEEARNDLLDLANGHERHETAVRNGPVVDELLKEIEDYRPDLIVVGTHGSSGFKHLLMSSVSERLVRASPAPVLTLRGGGG